MLKQFRVAVTKTASLTGGIRIMELTSTASKHIPVLFMKDIEKSIQET